MSRRRQLEHEVSVAQERIKKAAKDTPKDILKLWEQELVDLELELNNMVDDAEAAKAIEQLNGAEYVGRSMVVKEALPKN